MKNDDTHNIEKAGHDPHGPYSLYMGYPDLLVGSNASGESGESGESALVGSTEPSLLRVVRDLDAAYAPPVPPAHLSAAIEQAIATHAEGYRPTMSPANGHLAGASISAPHTSSVSQVATPMLKTKASANARPARWLPATRLGWAAALLVAFLALSAATYAMLPVLQRAFQIAGVDHIDGANLGQQVDYRQTINGYTVAVKRVYADPNRIIIGYVVEQPAAPQPGDDSKPGGASNTRSDAHPASEKLTTGEGVALQPMVGAGSGVQGGEAGYVLTYDALALGDPAAMPREVDLRFTLDLVTLRVEGAQPAPTTRQTGPDSWAVEAQPVRQDKVAGPFVFDLSIPMPQARIAEVGQTVESAGVSVTLERVVVTPAEARFYLRYAPPNGRTDLEWVPVHSLRVNGLERGSGAITGGNKLSSDRWYSSVLAPLYDEQGEWTFTINELVGMPDLNGVQFESDSELQEALKQERVRGPWAFKFTVPPAPATEAQP